MDIVRLASLCQQCRRMKACELQVPAYTPIYGIYRTRSTSQGRHLEFISGSGQEGWSSRNCARAGYEGLLTEPVSSTARMCT